MFSIRSIERGNLVCSWKATSQSNYTIISASISIDLPKKNPQIGLENRKFQMRKITCTYRIATDQNNMHQELEQSQRSVHYLMHVSYDWFGLPHKSMNLHPPQKYTRYKQSMVLTVIWLKLRLTAMRTIFRHTSLVTLASVVITCKKLHH